VATVQDAYRQSMLSAEGEYTVSLAKAKSQRIYAQALAESRFALASAPAYTVWQIAIAASTKTYQTEEATNYQKRVSTWASLQNGRWATYQRDLARAEVQAVRGRGDAGVLRARQIWTANTLWVQATTAAQLAYTSELHGEGGAEVQQAQKIAAAHVENGTNGAISTFVTAQSNATHKHDLEVANENLLYLDALALADAERDRQVSEARHDLVREYIRADYQANQPEGISQQQYDELLDRADQQFLEQAAIANETHAVTVAESRRDWTIRVGALNVQFVKQIVAAQQDRAVQVGQEKIVLATGVATAQWEYARRNAEGLERQAGALSAAEGADQIRNAQIETQMARWTGSAANQQAMRRTQARGVYEVGLHADRVSATTLLDNQDGTPWSRYQNRVALGDYAWANGRASIRVLKQQATGLSLSVHSGLVGSANQAQAIRESAIDSLWAMGLAANDRLLAVNMAAADADQFLTQKLAEVALLISAADSQGQADIAYAQAQRDRDNAYAEAAVLWVQRVSSARVKYTVGEIPWQQYDAQRDDAYQQRQEAKAQADEIFLQATDAADSQQQGQLAAARVAYVDASGTANTNQAAAIGMARELRAGAQGQQEVRTARKRAQAARQRFSALQTADDRQRTALHAVERLSLERIRDIGTAQAAARGAAEAAYHLAQATQTALSWQLAIGNDWEDSNRLWQAARSVARATWFEELVIPYTSYRSTSAQLA
ncbi:MAG: hypothetical protein ACC645_24575, partial [Pirellulales bacterium]